MQNVACAVRHALGNVWEEHQCAFFCFCCHVCHTHLFSCASTRWALNCCLTLLSRTAAVLTQRGWGVRMQLIKFRQDFGVRAAPFMCAEVSKPLRLNFCKLQIHRGLRSPGWGRPSLGQPQNFVVGQCVVLRVSVL